MERKSRESFPFPLHLEDPPRRGQVPVSVLVRLQDRSETNTTSVCKRGTPESRQLRLTSTLDRDGRPGHKNDTSGLVSPDLYKNIVDQFHRTTKVLCRCRPGFVSNSPSVKGDVGTHSRACEGHTSTIDRINTHRKEAVQRWSLVPPPLYWVARTKGH